jgi:hypothetical protein
LYHDSRVKQVDPEEEILLVEIIVTICEGRDLVAKDKNMFGRPTTSDPYVKLSLGRNKLGKTSIIKKTLDPNWGNETFRLSVAPRSLEVTKSIECRIFDYDAMSSDDAMGTVFVPIPRTRNTNIGKWYPVERGEDINFCKNATGELLVEVEVRSELEKPKLEKSKLQIRSQSQH